MNKYNQYAPVVLRIGISLLMLWFGFVNVFSPITLVGYLSPSVTNLIPFSPLTFMVINGVFEILFGALLLVGFLTRIYLL